MENFHPLVSVIINCYNGERYLREAIESVIAQTYSNWELIFWDNQSIDNTRKIVESFNDKRIHYYYSPYHTPLGEARNLAVEQAKGEYINFLDSDDYWSSEKLKTQVDSIIDTSIGFIFTDFQIILESMPYNQSTYSLFKRIQKRRVSDDIYHELLKGNFIVFSSVLFDKTLYQSIGGINSQFQQNEDYELLLKCSMRQKVIHINKPLTYYRIHGSNGSNSNGRNGSEGLFENRVIFGSLPDSKELRKSICDNETRIAIEYIRKSKFMKGVKHLITEGSLINLFCISYRRLTSSF